MRPRRNGRYNTDDIFKCIFLKENVWIPTKISLKFVPKGPINNIPALVQIMAWRRPGDKPLSEPMMVSLLTHICVTRPQWVNIAHTPQYGTTPVEYVVLRVQVCFLKYGWLWVGITYVRFEITYDCLIPRILPVFAVGPQCQHIFYVIISFQEH